MMEPGTLSTRLARLRDHIDPRLTSGDVERLVTGAARLHRRRRLRRWAVSTCLLSASLLMIMHETIRPRSGAPVTKNVMRVTVEPRAASPVIRLQDGSYAASPEGPAAISVEEDTPRRASLVLREGKMRFHVVPTRERTFTVEAGAVKVTVLGMAFTMERIADRVEVSAEGSPLLVEWGSGHRLLEVGESGWFPPAETPALTSGSAKPAGHAAAATSNSRSVAPATVAAPTAAASTLAPSALAPPTLAPPTLAPSALAPSTLAPSTLAPSTLAPSTLAPSTLASSTLASPTTVAAPTVASRWEAADAARQGGRPREGAELLQRLLDEHPTDPRAPLAAFTLGRVLLKDLGRPREAAAAFARARALAPHGPFAEDALAREVEAWARTEEIGTRRARAEMYLRLFPAGRRVAAMAAWAAP